MEEKKDIVSRKDIELIVEKFYNECLNDSIIAFLFTDVAQINLEEHLPIICDFWESTLLGSRVDSRNTMLKHIDLHRKEPLLPQYFDQWIGHWTTVVNSYHQGPTARLAVQRASMIADLMQHKIAML